MTVLDKAGDAAPVRQTHMSRGQLLALILLLASQFMLAVDFSILNVALPQLGTDLGIGDSNLQWVATAFALCAAGFTLFFGRVADYAGRRRMFLIGMAGLGIASLVGGLAVDPTMLMIARVAQGMSTAVVTPAALSLLTTQFPEGPLRDRALGLNSVMMSLGFTSGAIAGGLLTSMLSWRWAFFVNVPVALVVILLAPKLLRDSPVHRKGRLDIVGSVLVTVGLVLLVFGVTRAGEEGFGDPIALTALAVAVVLLATFTAVELRIPEPLVQVRYLARRNLGLGNVAGLVTFAMESALVFLMTMYLQHVLGLSPMECGFALGALGVGAVLGGSVGPAAIARWGLRGTLVGGLAIQGGLTLTLLVLGESMGWLAAVLLLTFVGAIGHVAAIVGFMVAATTGLPDTEQGVATGLATMTQQVGMAMGVPIVSAIAVTAGGLESLSALKVAIGVDGAIVLVAAALMLGLRKATAPQPVTGAAG